MNRPRTPLLLILGTMIGVLSAAIYLPLAGPFRTEWQPVFQFDQDNWAIFYAVSDYPDFVPAFDFTGKRQMDKRIFDSHAGESPDLMDIGIQAPLMLLVWPNIVLSPITNELAGMTSMGLPRYFHIAYGLTFTTVNILGWSALLFVVFRSVGLVFRNQEKTKTGEVEIPPPHTRS